MSYATVTLLENIVEGIPSGNYDGSSLDFSSDPVEAAGYYQGFGNIQTVTIRLTDFRGIVKLVGTLGDDPTQSAWFDIEEFDYTSSSTTLTIAPSYTGNFVWLRADIIDFVSGTINFITISY